MPTCTLSPGSVTPGSNSATSTLTITAGTKSVAMLAPSRHLQLGKSLFAVWLPLMFGIAVLGASKKTPRRHWILCSFLAVMFISQIACGGSSSSSNGAVNQGPTNYTVMVTGTSGAIQHTTQLTVTVH